MITTPAELADRLHVHKDTQAMAAQFIPGGLIGYLRAFIVDEYGEMNVIGRKADGKVERAGEAFERVTGEKLSAKARKVVSKSVYKRNYRGAK